MNGTHALRRAALLGLSIVAALPPARAQEIPATPPAKLVASPTSTAGEPVRLDPLTVESARTTNAIAAAANAQRHAPNITSVSATAEFGPFIDSNPGEFLKYLPGIDIEPIAPGYSRFSVHGLGPGNTEILFDGLPLANMHGERTGRNFDVSLVSAADVVRAEVRKLPLPSDSANAIGGTINLVRRSALDLRHRRIAYQAGLRADAQTFTTEPLLEPGGRRLDRWHPSWQIVWTEPVRRDLGFSIALGKDELILNQEFASLGRYLGTPANNAAAEHAIAAGQGVPAAASIFNPALTSATLLESPQHQLKDYATARIDWRPRPELEITGDLGVHNARQIDRQALYTWNITPNSTSEVAHDATHTFGPPGGGSIRHNGQVWREAANLTTSATLTAKWTKDQWELSAKAGWSRLGFRFADTRNGYFGSTSVGSVAGLIDIPLTGVGLQTANPMPLTLDSRHGYWGPAQFDARTTAPGTTNDNLPVDWQGNDVMRIGGARSRPGRAEEIVTTVKLHAKRRFSFATPTSVRLGVDWSERFRNRRYDYHAWRFVGTDGVANSPDDSAAPISTGPGTTRRDPIYGYPEPASISMARLYRLYQEHPAWFRYEAAHSERLSLTNDPAYDVTETVTAPYLEFETAPIRRRLRLTGGVRYERTEAKAHGLLTDNGAAYLHYADGTIVHAGDTNPASSRSDGRLAPNLGTATAVNYLLVNGPALLPTVRAGAPVFSTEIQAAGNAARAAGETTDAGTNLGRGTLAHTRAVYREKGATNTALNDGVYPSLHATYVFSDRLALQLGYARTQARIDYATALIPNNQVTDEVSTSGDAAGAIGRITLQNPNLRPWTADNFEARLSWSFERCLVALSAFQKQVRNFQPQIDTPPLSAADLASYAELFPDAALGPEYAGYSLRYRTNAGSARINGAELELRAPLDAWLPAWSRGFELSGNATYIHRDGANGDELGLNRAWMGSANLRYARDKLAVRIGYRFNGEQIVGAPLLSNGRTGQTIRKPQNLFDVTIEYTVRPHARLFLAVSNLTNELTVDEQRFPDKPACANLSVTRNIGRTCALGVTGSF